MSSLRSFGTPGFAASALVVSLFAACSDSASYTLCGDECVSGGDSSDSGGSSTSGGSSGGSSASSSGGNSGSSASGGDGGGGAGGIAASGSAGTLEAAGEGGGAGEGGAPVSSCDVSASPVDEPCLVSDAFAVFAKAGSSAGDGSLAKPLGSLSEAIRVADEQGKPVVVACVGSFREQVELSRPSGSTLHVVGGFLCSSGEAEYMGTATVLEAASGPSLALSAAHNVGFSDFEIRSRDAEGPGESSIAAIVSKSEGVTFTRVLLSAGKGAAGANGKGEWASFTEAALEGHAAQGTTGGAARQDCGCSTVGGRGGNATGSIDGEPGLPDFGAGNGGLGGANCSVGKAGAAAPATPPGPGATSYGTLKGTSWEPSPGENGETGKAGQGGGGGGGENKTGGGAGGGGACGGCGGKGGDGGGGGGASIGLLLVDSAVTFEDSVIATSDAGRGGDGGAPQPGQLGGKGGFQTSGGCPGGAGGEGAAGGNGGGGAGGISVGILYRGTAPSLTGVSITTGARAPGGAGDPAAPAESDGIDGVNPETLDADAAP